MIVRGTKKLRDRLKGAPTAADTDGSTTALGDWFATALFWRPQVALLVNERTMLPVLVPLAPATTLLDRVPAAIQSVLRLHGVDPDTIASEVAAMSEVRIAPTNNRSVVGVMNEFAFLAEHWKDELVDLDELSFRLSQTPVGPLRDRTGFPDQELAAVLGSQMSPTLAEVIPFPSQASPTPEPGPERPAPAATADVHQLKVTLHDTKPPIWRRVLVDGAATLDHVHEVIQAAFGWWNCHLHEFEIDGRNYGVPDPDDDWGTPTVDESRVRLDVVAEAGAKFDYVYDFGDGWRHKIVVEKILPADPTTIVPACIGGRRACPPEDCGGTWGYTELLDILADPTHPEYDERREWIGRPFDPDTFNPAEFEDNLRNQQLTSFDDWS